MPKMLKTLSFAYEVEQLAFESWLYFFQLFFLVIKKEGRQYELVRKKTMGEKDKV